ncbi:Uncharacterised protein [Enterobacter hormaechei]|nr:Uncharacterised protein [Enterobacter hormaechei]
MVALGAQLFFPDRDRFGNVAFFPAGRAHRPGSVRRKRRDGKGVAQSGKHRRRDGFDEIRGGVRHHWRPVRTAGIDRLQRHREQRFAGQRQRLPVAFNQLLTFAAVAFGDRPLEFHQRAVARQNISQVEERHLHNRIDTRRQAAFAGDLRGVNDIQARLFLVKHCLDFLGQACPDLVGAVRGVDQENTAGLQALGHLIFINELELVTANKIRLRNQVCRADRVFADAQMGNGQSARFFGVVDEIPLRIPRRRVADNFDVVLGCRDAAVATQTVEQRFQFRSRGQGFFRQGQRKVSHVIINADRKARLRFCLAEFSKYRQDALRSELFGRQSITPANDARQRFALTAVKRLSQSGHHIQIKWLSLCARLFGAVQYRHCTRAIRQGCEQVFR